MWHSSFSRWEKYDFKFVRSTIEYVILRYWWVTLCIELSRIPRGFVAERFPLSWGWGVIWRENESPFYPSSIGEALRERDMPSSLGPSPLCEPKKGSERMKSRGLATVLRTGSSSPCRSSRPIFQLSSLNQERIPRFTSFSGYPLYLSILLINVTTNAMYFFYDRKYSEIWEEKGLKLFYGNTIYKKVVIILYIYI